MVCLLKFLLVFGEISTKVCFDNTEQELYNEAIQWFKHISTYFGTSQDTYKINIGRLKGVFPVNCTNDSVEFSVDYIDKESWKDWFIQEGV